MHGFLQDIRYGLRMLAKAPEITLAAIFAFGLSIGANTATFSTANTFLLHPISLPQVDRLAMVLSCAPGQTEGWSEVSPAAFQEWRAQNHSFESLAAYEWDDVNLTGVGEPIKVQGFRVSANFFDVLRTRSFLGRTFLNGEDEPGRSQVVILGNGLWRRQFASDPGVIGRTIHLDGTARQSVLTFRVALPNSRYETPRQRAAFFDSLTERLNHSSSVQTSTVTIGMPFSGGDTDSYSIEGQPVQPGEFHEAEFNNVGVAFFQLLHVSLVAGREFSNSDSEESMPVAIVSANFAERNWPGKSALGHHIKPGDEDSKDPWATVVGVVAEVNYNLWRHDPPPAVYFPFRQRPGSNAFVAVRSNADQKTLIPMVRAAVAGIDPDQPLYDLFPLDRLISNQILGLSYIAVMMGVFGFMALVLSAVGVSGLMAHVVSQRVHEIGVRMAIGAKSAYVLRMFILNGLKLLALGVAIGLPLAFALARLLSSSLFGVQSNDFTSFSGGAWVLVAVVLFACYIPARAATRVDPIIALRYE